MKTKVVLLRIDKDVLEATDKSATAPFGIQPRKLSFEMQEMRSPIDVQGMR